MLYDIITYLPMFVTAFWALNLLASKGKEGNAKIILGIFMLLSFLLYLSHAIYFQKVESAYLFIDPIYTFTTLSIYPTFLWYIKMLTTSRGNNARDLFMFLPALVLSTLTIILYLLMDSQERYEYIHDYLFKAGRIQTTSVIMKAQAITYLLSRICFGITVIYVFIVGRSLVSKHNKLLGDFFSNLNNKTFHWINWTLYLFIFTAIISIIFNIVGRCFFLDSNLIFIPSIIFSIILFMLGHLGNQQKHDINNLKIIEPENNKYKTTGEKANAQLLDSLAFQFEENKIYRQQELKITDLASLLNTNRTYISNLINLEFNYSFNEYVNRYRIKEAKQLIIKETDEPLEHIAIKVGYGSLSTFFRTFKQQEGVTPNHYKKLHGEKA